MSESLSFSPIGTDKENTYQHLLPQLRALVEHEPDLLANMANIASALHEQFHWLWTGFYLVRNEELVLGPFQGPIACTRIPKGKGVCGASWAQEKTIVVPDVHLFPGHIACSGLSNSEIVIPVFNGSEILGVFDIDSERIGAFDSTDQYYLEQIVSWLSGKLHYVR